MGQGKHMKPTPHDEEALRVAAAAYGIPADDPRGREILRASMAFASARRDLALRALWEAIKTDALRARGPVGWYARLLLRVSGVPSPEAESLSADDKLREAESEIARHHDLIVELRDGLRWALDYILSNGSSPDQADRWRELDQLLKRRVG